MNKSFFFFFIALAFVRLLFLVISPLELSPDEAYYWDWSRRLSLCYYSKPPMVAWLIWLSTHFLGSTEIGVRLPAALLGLGTTVFLFFLGKRIAQKKVGLLASIVFSATLGSALASYIMTIDAPLLFFWSGALLFFWKAIEQDIFFKKQNLWLWSLCGLLAGFALLSKQTGIALSLSMAIFLFLFKETRSILKTKGFLLLILLQILCLLPIGYWNYHHDWITFSHTAHHFEQKNSASFFFLNFKTFFEFLGSQFGIITPIIFMLLMISSICAVYFILSPFKKGKKADKNTLSIAFLLIFGLLPLVGVLALSLKQRINANWPAPFYLSLSIIIALWHENIFDCKYKALDRFKKLVPFGYALGFILVGILYCLPFFADSLGISGKPYDPTVRLRGWKALAKEVDLIIKDLFPSNEKVFVVARRRQTVSELAFYLKGQPIVYRWNGIEGKIKSQYELWQGPIKKIGYDALIVFDKEKGLKGIDSCFKKFLFLKTLKIPLGSGKFREFNVYLGKTLIHWRKSA